MIKQSVIIYKMINIYYNIPSLIKKNITLIYALWLLIPEIFPKVT